MGKKKSIKEMDVFRGWLENKRCTQVFFWGGLRHKGHMYKRPLCLDGLQNTTQYSMTPAAAVNPHSFLADEQVLAHQNTDRNLLFTKRPNNKYMSYVSTKCL